MDTHPLSESKVDSSAGPVTRHEWRIDVSDAFAFARGDERMALASTLVVPDVSRPVRDTLLFCLPGGFLSRRYFDLATPEEAERGDRTPRRYSFAEAMAKQGFATLALDHVGIGDSTLPAREEDALSIGVDETVAANALALERILERLRGGEVPGLEGVRTIGVGHSMGSMLTVEQQATSQAHDGLVLFSFSTHGTPAFLDDRMRAYADDPVRLRAEMPSLVRDTMGQAFPERATGADSDRRAAFGVGTAPDDAEDALHLAASRLFAAGGLTAMVPGGSAPAAEKISAPVLMVFGDHDLHDDRHTRDELPNVDDLTTSCLADAWHCHFVANTRETLWDGVADWIEKRRSAQCARTRAPGPWKGKPT